MLLVVLYLSFLGSIEKKPPMLNPIETVSPFPYPGCCDDPAETMSGMPS